MMSKAARKMKHTLLKYNTDKNPSDKLTKVWNKIQAKFECCGVDSYHDWRNSSFRGAGMYSEVSIKHPALLNVLFLIFTESLY